MTRFAGDVFDGFQASSAGTNALTGAERNNAELQGAMYSGFAGALGDAVQAKAITEASKRQARAQQQSSGGLGGIAGGLLGSFLGPIGGAAGKAVGKLFG